jgi:hypothetical protein
VVSPAPVLPAGVALVVAGLGLGSAIVMLLIPSCVVAAPTVAPRRSTGIIPVRLGISRVAVNSGVSAQRHKPRRSLCCRRIPVIAVTFDC